MDFRSTLTQLLALARNASDADILDAVRELKGLDRNAIAYQAAQPLAAAAAVFQKRAAEGGVNYDFAVAVQMVQDGTAW